jgi:hypothetical protein
VHDEPSKVRVVGFDVYTKPVEAILVWGQTPSSAYPFRRMQEITASKYIAAQDAAITSVAGALREAR